MGNKSSKHPKREEGILYMDKMAASGRTGLRKRSEMTREEEEDIIARITRGSYGSALVHWQKKSVEVS